MIEMLSAFRLEQITSNNIHNKSAGSGTRYPDIRKKYLDVQVRTYGTPS